MRHVVQRPVFTGSEHSPARLRRWSPRWPTWSVLRSCLASAVLVVGPLVLTGCPGTASPGKTDTANDPTSKKLTTAKQSEIEDQLRSALFQLQPENLGIDARLDDALALLNNWWGEIVTHELQPTGANPPAIPDSLLPEATRELLVKDAYVNDDGRHLRDAYLAKTIVSAIGDQTEDEIERVTRLFDWVCRNITLVADDEPMPPLSFFESLVVGRGRAADRAIAFGKLLRQWRLDAVVLQPKGASGPDVPWVIGVLLEGEVYLFDARLGLCLPAGGKPQVRALPATLKQYLAHPEWSKALSTRTDQAYEPSAEQLQDATVAVIANPIGWSPRMWRLEQLLPGDRLCVLYDPPAALGDNPGVIGRLAAASPQWPADRLGLWMTPMIVEAQFANLNQRGVQLVSALLAAYSAPIDVIPTREGTPRLSPSNRQLRTRVQQLQAEYSAAIAQYLTIRQLAISPPPEPNWTPIYARAAEDALYFTCICKFESRQYASAEESLNDYLKRFRRNGRWAVPARSLLAETQLAQSKTAEAIQTLKMSLIGDDAYRTTVEILIKRWSEPSDAAAPAPGPAAPATEPPKPTTDAPQSPSATPTPTPTPEPTPPKAGNDKPSPPTD